MRIKKSDHRKDTFVVQVDADEVVVDSGKTVPYPTWIGTINVKTGKVDVWTPAASVPRGYRSAAKRMLEEALDDARAGKLTPNPGRHSGQMSQRVMSIAKPPIDADLRRRYEFFKTFGGGGRVGHAAEDSLNLARAERIAEERGWDTRWEEEQESWESFLGDEMTLDDISEVLWCGLYASDDEDAELLDSLGGITFGHDSRENRNYRRLVAAELALQACQEKDLL